MNQIDSHLTDIESQECVPDGIFDSLAIMKGFVKNVIGRSRSQTKITDFFACLVSHNMTMKDIEL